MLNVSTLVGAGTSASDALRYGMSRPGEIVPRSSAQRRPVVSGVDGDAVGSVATRQRDLGSDRASVCFDAERVEIEHVESRVTEVRDIQATPGHVERLIVEASRPSRKSNVANPHEGRAVRE